jgi:hypothetical protein
MTAVVQFASTADHILETEERIVELIDCLVDLGTRLSALEKTLVEAAGADPLSAILVRLDAFDARLATLETRQRRPVPLTLVQNHRLDPDERQVFLELQGLFNKLDRELKQHMSASDGRIAHYASQFRKIRERLAAVERRGA